jgi:hypothetical protein
MGCGGFDSGARERERELRKEDAWGTLAEEGKKLATC